jgi:hypothetical protein
MSSLLCHRSVSFVSYDSLCLLFLRMDSCLLAKPNRDREGPHGLPPPTPPDRRVTYPAVRQMKPKCGTHPDRSVFSRCASGQFIPGVETTRRLAGCHLATPPQVTTPLDRSGLQRTRRAPIMPSADFCGTVTEDCSSLSPFPGHTADLPGSVVGPSVHQRLIYKARPTVDGGLCCSVPARPERATPHSRFVFLTPHICSTLPSDPASRRRPCASLVLRLHVYLDRGLSPPSTTTCPAHTPALSRAA